VSGRSVYCLFVFAVFSGCSQVEVAPTATESFLLANVSDLPSKTSPILAQGRLQPSRGLIRISGVPGDRVDAILVKPGQSIKKNDLLLVLQSRQARSLELEAATLRLQESMAIRLARQQEADLAIEAAKLRLKSAHQLVIQSESQQRIAGKNGEQIESIREQISTLQELRDSPLTRAAIGTVELESKKNELLKVSSQSEQANLMADQAVEMARLQVDQSERAFVAATESRKLVDASTPIGSLQKQIEILRLQLEQSSVVSPVDGIVVNQNIEVGERVGPIPLFEMADLSEMVCIAEVHESDVAKIAIDDRAELRSSALGKKLSGRVQRIDRMVGSAQMRSPNPMARSDFRSIPVWIAIDAEDTKIAAERLQLQVEVAILTTR